MHGTLTAPEERFLVCPEKTSLEISLRRFPQVHHFVHYSATGPGGEHSLKKFTQITRFFFSSENVHKERQIQQLYILNWVTFLWDGVFFPDVVTRCGIFLMYLLLNF